MARASAPFLDQNVVVIPRQHLHTARGSVMLHDIAEGVTLERVHARRSSCVGALAGNASLTEIFSSPLSASWRMKRLT